MNRLHILCIVFIGLMVKELQGQQRRCTTAYGGQGQCKLLDSCAPLAALAYKMPRNPQDTDVLRRSHCGYYGNSPAVCCPENEPRPPPPPTPLNNACTTPYGIPGQCIDLHSCAHLAKLLQAPVLNENVQYVSNSRCHGPAKYSVCCGQPPIATKNMCKSSVSAFPPDPESKCCGVDASFGNKISGGSEAAIDQFPWSALIEYRSQIDDLTKLYCGGSLISSRYVLTAAHCLVGRITELATPVYVRLGEYDTQNEGQDCVESDCTDGAIRIPIEKKIVHPDYKYGKVSKWDDIALIRLSRNAPYNEFIRPICLPKEDLTRTGDSFYNFTVAGWGATSNSTPFSPIKLFVDLPYVSRDKCQKALKNRIATLGKGQLCAGGMAGKDTCRGDSGGALMLDHESSTYAVGVVSFGREDCGLSEDAGIYTNVYQYLDWIRSNISA